MPRIPPKEHQFKPGQSGNPGGRPKGLVSFSVLLRRAGQKVDPKTGKSLAQLAAEAIMARAARGDVAAVDFFAERTDGKVAETVKIVDRRAELEKIKAGDPGETVAALVARLQSVTERLSRYGRDRNGHRRDHRGAARSRERPR